MLISCCQWLWEYECYIYFDSFSGKSSSSLYLMSRIKWEEFGYLESGKTWQIPTLNFTILFAELSNFNLLWSQKLYFSLVSHVKILFPKHLNFSTKCRLWPLNEMGFHFGKWSWIPGVVAWSYLKLNVLYPDWSVTLFLRRPLSCTSDLKLLWIF